MEHKIYMEMMMNLNLNNDFIAIGILVFLCYVGGGINTYFNKLGDSKMCPKAVQLQEVKK